jgi:hypothetical protein
MLKSKRKTLREIEHYLDELIQHADECTGSDGNETVMAGYLNGYDRTVRKIRGGMPGKTVKDLLAYVHRKLDDADLSVRKTEESDYDSGFTEGSEDALRDLERAILDGYSPLRDDTKPWRRGDKGWPPVKH